MTQPFSLTAVASLVNTSLATHLAATGDDYRAVGVPSDQPDVYDDEVRITCNGDDCRFGIQVSPDGDLCVVEDNRNRLGEIVSITYHFHASGPTALSRVVGKLLELIRTTTLH